MTARLCAWMRQLLAVAIVAIAGQSAVDAAPTLLRGSDYLQTTEGTNFLGLPFAGVAVGPGNTDTIVRRLDDVAGFLPGSTAVIPIELVSLNLVSAIPVDLGAGLGLHYITLQSQRGGPASVGRMSIDFFATGDDHLPNTPEGSFNSFFDVFFDLRLGALDGPIVLSDVLRLNSLATPWDADPPASALIVPGAVGDVAANLHLDRSADQMDFFPQSIIEQHAGRGTHLVRLATPEPASVALVVIALLGLLGAGARPRTRA